MKYTEYKGLNLPALGEEMRKYWEDNDIFAKSLSTREGHKRFVFFEGPPSANGMPGIHHVMARTIKDIVCRYQTLTGKYVGRKGGWDTARHHQGGHRQEDLRGRLQQGLPP